MPAQRLPDEPDTVAVPPLGLFGIYYDSNFVLHAAFATWDNTDLLKPLTEASGKAQFGQPVALFDMGPPLGFKNSEVHVAGWLEDLSQDEVSLLWHWLGVAQGYITGHSSGPNEPNLDYIMHPAYQEIPAEEAGRTRMRFSCTGLVLWCYERIGIRLVDWTNPSMPLVTNKQVVKFLRLCNSVDPTRLPSDRSTWRIVNAGYLFHSLQRPSSAIRSQPYLPLSEAELAFPQVPDEK